MRQHSLILAALLALTTAPPARAAETAPLPTAKPEEKGVSSERIKRVDDVIRRYIDGQRIAGAVTLVARHGSVVHHEAHGKLAVDSDAPMQKDSLFRMASSTKPVTGVAVLMLIEEGKIGLTDPVSRYIPEFKTLKVATVNGLNVELVPAAREVTIRDLLTHTSGLVSGGFGSKQGNPELLRPGNAGATLAEAVPRYAAVPLDFQPGTLWRYSGLAGIDTLARVVEVASNQSFEDFLKARIFEPLGMTETYFRVPDDKRDRMASIHRRTDKGLEKVAPMFRFPDTYHSGAGGLTSTAADYFRFGQMFLDRGKTHAGKSLLSPRGVELFGTNQVGDLFAHQIGRPGGMGFGFTVEVVTDPAEAGTFRSAGSFGWDGAFGTHFFVDPEKDLVAVLLVQTSGRELHRDFETAVMQSLLVEEEKED